MKIYCSRENRKNPLDKYIGQDVWVKVRLPLSYGTFIQITDKHKAGKNHAYPDRYVYVYKYIASKMLLEDQKIKIFNSESYEEQIKLIEPVTCVTLSEIEEWCNNPNESIFQ